MPFSYQLTWMPRVKRWRKRYLKKTYFLKTKVNGKRDRQRYEAAFHEWQRLKAYIDGLGPNPYTATGVLIPESQVVDPARKYYPPAPQSALVQSVGQSNGKGNGHSGNGNGESTVARQPQRPNLSSDDPAFIQGVGLGAFAHPELVVRGGNGSPYSGERRIEVLADFWLDRRRKQADRGELSLKQWAEDKAKLQIFRNFIAANYSISLIDEIDAAMLNLFRDSQWEFVDSDNGHRISKATLKKRLDTIGKWFHWLVDQNVLAKPPKDLSRYGRVKLNKPRPLFWSVDDIQTLANNATERTRLYVMLGPNLGYTQKDIAMLECEHVDWETGIISRDRLKTGVPSKANWTAPGLVVSSYYGGGFG